MRGDKIQFLALKSHFSEYNKEERLDGPVHGIWIASIRNYSQNWCYSSIILTFSATSAFRFHQKLDLTFEAVYVGTFCSYQLLVHKLSEMNEQWSQRRGNSDDALMFW